LQKRKIILFHPGLEITDEFFYSRSIDLIFRDDLAVLLQKI